MKGLMDLLGASQGIILLEKGIEKDHKLAANELQISMLSEPDFDTYAKCTSKDYKEIKSALCIGESWDSLFDIGVKFPNLRPVIEYIKSGFWNENAASSKVRHLLGVLKHVKSEFNPENILHIALLTDMISLFSIGLNDIVCSIFNQYLMPESKEQLDEELKILIWGGIENYSYWSQLRKRVEKQAGMEESELSLPEWNMFLQLVRACLDEPFSTAIVPLILKEVAFEYLANESVKGNLTYSSELAKSNKQAAKFAMLLVGYVCKAVKMPPEFDEKISKRLFSIQA